MKMVVHVKDLEDILGSLIPHKAVIELQKYQEEYPNILGNKFSVRVDRISITEESKSSVGIKNMLNNGDDYKLDLSYSMTEFKRKGIHKAVCENKILFKGKANKFYKIYYTLSTSLALDKDDDLTDTVDKLLFEICYSFMKNAIEYIDFSSITDVKFELPDRYPNNDSLKVESFKGYLNRFILGSKGREENKETNKDSSKTPLGV